MEDLKNLINSHDWKKVLKWGAALNDEERVESLSVLYKIDIDVDLMGRKGNDLEGEERKDFYKTRSKSSTTLTLARIVCTRNYEDVRKAEKKLEWYTEKALYSYLFEPGFGYEPLFEFYKLFPPDYLDRYLKELSKERFFNVNFKVIWKLYENGWIQFDEEFFARRLFTLYGFNNNHFNDAQFLIDHPEALEKVFLKFYKYQIPVLDLIKCETIDYSNGLSAKASTYWTEVFKILIERQVIKDRIVVNNLLESLLNDWKKPHLDWHIRLLELFKPEHEELLDNQRTLFSCLGSSNITVINFALRCVEQVYISKKFLAEDFITNAQVVLTKEKCEKAILLIFSIIDILGKENAVLQNEIQQLIPIALLQHDNAVQVAAAELLVKYTKKDKLKSVIEPYESSLKQKARKILDVSESVIEDDVEIYAYANDIELLRIPDNWNDLLFHTGTCIQTKTIADIEIFIEGLNQLQDRLPTDLEKQMKPYTKKLASMKSELFVVNHLQHFFDAWLNGAEHYKDIRPEDSPVRFLHHKLRLLFYKLRTNNKLPFLSTPTHGPFYVHPGSLIDRMLEYESTDQVPDMEDLTIAVNRILLEQINDTVKEKAKKLKGKYSDIIQYLLNVHDKIEVKVSGDLPIWTQAARTKHPDKVFSEFNATEASLFPSVVNPFMPEFEVVTDHIWKRLKLEGNWNAHSWSDDKPQKYPHLFYYSGTMDRCSREDIPYQISFVPGYPDALLCKYLPDTSSGNEVRESEQCLYPMRTITEGKVRVSRGGWIYVAFCLLFEKKESRDLAVEYINMAILNKFTGIEYLTKSVGKMISTKHAPITRLLEYINRQGNGRSVKLAQADVLEQCILASDPNDLPVNFKKLAAAYSDMCEALNKTQPDIVKEKLKSLKK